MNHAIEFFDIVVDRGLTFKNKKHLSTLLTFIFNTMVFNIKLSLVEKTTIAVKIKDIMPLLDKYIFSLGNHFNPNLGKDNLILRSGIQFLLDDCKDWPTDQGCLNNHLQFLVQSDCLETFDNALQEWKKDPPSLAYDVLLFSEKELTRPHNVPLSHYWWW
jgi:hypothetical protein